MEEIEYLEEYVEEYPNVIPQILNNSDIEEFLPVNEDDSFDLLPVNTKFDEFIEEDPLVKRYRNDFQKFANAKNEEMTTIIDQKSRHIESADSSTHKDSFKNINFIKSQSSSSSNIEPTVKVLSCKTIDTSAIRNRSFPFNSAPIATSIHASRKPNLIQVTKTKKFFGQQIPRITFGSYTKLNLNKPIDSSIKRIVAVKKPNSLLGNLKTPVLRATANIFGSFNEKIIKYKQENPDLFPVKEPELPKSLPDLKAKPNENSIFTNKNNRSLNLRSKSSPMFKPNINVKKFSKYATKSISSLSMSDESLDKDSSILMDDEIDGSEVVEEEIVKTNTEEQNDDSDKDSFDGLVETLNEFIDDESHNNQNEDNIDSTTKSNVKSQSQQTIKLDIEPNIINEGTHYINIEEPPVLKTNKNCTRNKNQNNQDKHYENDDNKLSEKLETDGNNKEMLVEKLKTNNKTNKVKVQRKKSDSVTVKGADDSAIEKIVEPTISPDVKTKSSPNVKKFENRKRSDSKREKAELKERKLTSENLDNITNEISKSNEQEISQNNYSLNEENNQQREAIITEKFSISKELKEFIESKHGLDEFMDSNSESSLDKLFNGTNDTNKENSIQNELQESVLQSQSKLIQDEGYLEILDSNTLESITIISKNMEQNEAEQEKELMNDNIEHDKNDQPEVSSVDQKIDNEVDNETLKKDITGDASQNVNSVAAETSIDAQIEDSICEQVEVPICEQVENPICEKVDNPISDHVEIPVRDEVETSSYRQSDCSTEDQMATALYQQTEVNITKENKNVSTEQMDDQINEQSDILNNETKKSSESGEPEKDNLEEHKVIEQKEQSPFRIESSNLSESNADPKSVDTFDNETKEDNLDVVEEIDDILAEIDSVMESIHSDENKPKESESYKETLTEKENNSPEEEINTNIDYFSAKESGETENDDKKLKETNLEISLDKCIKNIETSALNSIANDTIQISNRNTRSKAKEKPSEENNKNISVDANQEETQTNSKTAEIDLNNANKEKPKESLDITSNKKEENIKNKNLTIDKTDISPVICLKKVENMPTTRRSSLQIQQNLDAEKIKSKRNSISSNDGNLKISKTSLISDEIKDKEAKYVEKIDNESKKDNINIAESRSDCVQSSNLILSKDSDSQKINKTKESDSDSVKNNPEKKLEKSRKEKINEISEKITESIKKFCKKSDNSPKTPAKMRTTRESVREIKSQNTNKFMKHFSVKETSKMSILNETKDKQLEFQTDKEVESIMIQNVEVINQDINIKETRSGRKRTLLSGNESNSSNRRIEDSESENVLLKSPQFNVKRKKTSQDNKSKTKSKEATQNKIELRRSNKEQDTQNVTSDASIVNKKNDIKNKLDESQFSSNILDKNKENKNKFSKDELINEERILKKRDSRKSSECSVKTDKSTIKSKDTPDLNKLETSDNKSLTDEIKDFKNKQNKIPVKDIEETNLKERKLIQKKESEKKTISPEKILSSSNLECVEIINAPPSGASTVSPHCTRSKRPYSGVKMLASALSESMLIPKSEKRRDRSKTSIGSGRDTSNENKNKANKANLSTLPISAKIIRRRQSNLIQISRKDYEKVLKKNRIKKAKESESMKHKNLLHQFGIEKSLKVKLKRLSLESLKVSAQTPVKLQNEKGEKLEMFRTEITQKPILQEKNAPILNRRKSSIEEANKILTLKNINDKKEKRKSKVKKVDEIKIPTEVSQENKIEKQVVDTEIPSRLSRAKSIPRELPNTSGTTQNQNQKQVISEKPKRGVISVLPLNDSFNKDVNRNWNTEEVTRRLTRARSVPRNTTSLQKELTATTTLVNKNKSLFCAYSKNESDSEDTERNFRRLRSKTPTPTLQSPLLQTCTAQIPPSQINDGKIVSKEEPKIVTRISRSRNRAVRSTNKLNDIKLNNEIVSSQTEAVKPKEVIKEIETNRNNRSKSLGPQLAKVQIEETTKSEKEKLDINKVPAIEAPQNISVAHSESHEKEIVNLPNLTNIDTVQKQQENLVQTTIPQTQAKQDTAYLSTTQPINQIKHNIVNVTQPPNITKSVASSSNVSIAQNKQNYCSLKPPNVVQPTEFRFLPQHVIVDTVFMTRDEYDRKNLKKIITPTPPPSLIVQQQMKNKQPCKNLPTLIDMPVSAANRPTSISLNRDVDMILCKISDLLENQIKTESKLRINETDELRRKIQRLNNITKMKMSSENALQVLIFLQNYFFNVSTNDSKQQGKQLNITAKPSSSLGDSASLTPLLVQEGSNSNDSEKYFPFKKIRLQKQPEQDFNHSSNQLLNQNQKSLLKQQANLRTGSKRLAPFTTTSNSSMQPLNKTLRSSEKQLQLSSSSNFTNRLNILVTNPQANKEPEEILPDLANVVAPQIKEETPDESVLP